MARRTAPRRAGRDASRRLRAARSARDCVRWRAASVSRGGRRAGQPERLADSIRRRDSLGRLRIVENRAFRDLVRPTMARSARSRAAGMETAVGRNPGPARGGTTGAPRPGARPRRQTLGTGAA
ncbi:hypothetical protein RZS08_11290, partial [Arthrospira platensis SPKY1]|nr:hypothetical protein [Arthrospira platensis SPKY1]